MYIFQLQKPFTDGNSTKLNAALLYLGFDIRRHKRMDNLITQGAHLLIHFRIEFKSCQYIGSGIFMLLHTGYKSVYVYEWFYRMMNIH